MFVSLIPQLMKLKKWNATKLMRKAEIHYKTALDLSHGAIPATTMTLAKLCEAFNCQPNDLIMWEESE